MKIIFIDRDGVINEYPGHFKYVTSWEGFRFLPGAIEALKKFQSAGFRVCVISNQAGVSKGLYSQAELDRLTANMLVELTKQGVSLAGVYYCTHLKDAHCACRKPRTGMIDRALDEIAGGKKNVDLSNIFFIGDSMIDVETGRNAGMKTIMVFSGREKPENSRGWEFKPDYTADSLLEAARIVLKETA